MTPFEFISVALSFILGLGIARLLSSAVNVFRWRRNLELHWMPLVWAAIIFVFQIQYWWAIFELTGMVETWRLLHFGALLILAMLLFVAGALVLPMSEPKEGDSLLANFDRDGRWALVFLAGYFVISVWVTWFLWGISPLGFFGGVAAALLVGLIVFLVIRNRRAQGILTLLFLVLSVWASVEFSPAAY